MLVRFVGDRVGVGMAWSGAAWDEGADADFRATLSRWIYVGSGAAIDVITAGIYLPASGQAQGVHGGRGRRRTKP